MKITTELLQSLNACQSGISLVATYPDKDHEAVIRQLVADGHWDYANWLLPRLMDYRGYVSYAVYAAELVLPIWEKQYPYDDRPMRAIEAAKRCIDDPSEENKQVARAEAAAWAWVAAKAAEAAETEKIKSKIIEKGLEILLEIEKKEIEEKKNTIFFEKLKSIFPTFNEK